MKENKLFVLPVFIKTLMPTWMDFFENKLSDKSTPAVISPKVLANAKRNKSLPVKINAAILQQNKMISLTPLASAFCSSAKAPALALREYLIFWMKALREGANYFRCLQRFIL